METYAEVYDKPGVRLTKPLRLGYYSCNANRFQPNFHHLRYLVHADEVLEETYDLNVGFKNHIAKNPKDYENDLLHIQKWAQYCKRGYKKGFANAEIVCDRETLTDIAKTPYCREDSWRIVAVRHNGTIYLHDCAVIDGTRFAPPITKNVGRPAYWGHKFDHMMTSKDRHYYYFDEEEIQETNSEVVDCNKTHNAVFRTDIIKPDGEHIKLTYSTEIKAVDEHDNYVDVQTQASHLSNEFRLNKSWLWWLQCHLSSVDKVYVGIRSDIGVVHKIETVDKNFLRERAGRKCDVVMTFLSTVLSEVKKRCGDNLQISYNPETRRVHFEEAEKDKDFLIQDILKS